MKWWLTDRRQVRENFNTSVLRICGLGLPAWILACTIPLLLQLNNQKCVIEPKLLFNVIVAGLSGFQLLWTGLLAAGPYSWNRILPWSWLVQIGLDALFVLLYSLATATAQLNEASICRACSAKNVVNLTVDHKSFFCPTNKLEHRDTPLLFKRRGGAGAAGYGKGTGTTTMTGSYNKDRLIFNGIMIGVSVIFFCITLYCYLKTRKAAHAEDPSYQVANGADGSSLESMQRHDPEMQEYCSSDEETTQAEAQIVGRPEFVDYSEQPEPMPSHSKTPHQQVYVDVVELDEHESRRGTA